MEKLIYKDIIDEFFPGYQGRVEMFCYKIMNMDESELNGGVIKFKMDGGISIYFKGNINYLDFVNKEVGRIDMEIRDGGFFFDQPSVSNYRTPEGMYLLFLSLIDFQPEKKNSRDSLNLGLIGIFEGRNILYIKVFRNLIDLQSNTKQSSEFRLLNPLGLPKPKTKSVNDIQKISTKISSLTQELYNQVKLSIHWFEKSLFQDNIDFIITIWTSIEILMITEGHTNTKPIKDSLSKLYQMNSQEVGETFYIGQIEGLRGNIVHNGFLPRFSQESLPLFEYLRLLYHDLLVEKLDVDVEPKSKKYIDENDIDVFSMFKSLYH